MPEIHGIKTAAEKCSTRNGDESDGIVVFAVWWTRTLPDRRSIVRID